MDTLTFDQLPQAVSEINSKLDTLFILLENPQDGDSDRWMDIDDLCDYLPGKPAKATIYGKINKIPHKKEGKRLYFLKSEIDAWLKSKGRKTDEEIQSEASLKMKKGGSK